ncbi:MAG TPA: adenosylcobinamide-GDP ribazoletransferase [Acidimicrobiales bacterium]|nr:adenosylcobinamide-GDP ribazoletransferase [Acidimicrobiales bacterium]
MRARPRLTGGLRPAVAFLTVLGGAAAPTEAAVPWFPVVGALVGLAVGGAWWGAAQVWPRSVAAALAIAVDLALTGLLHADGLCDSGDGLIAPMSRERRLEVMRSPGAGAFGVTTVAVTVLLRFTALAAVAPSPLLIAGLWAGSRAWMALAMASVPYARADGLASSFVGARVRPAVMFTGLVIALGLVMAWRPGAGAAALAAGTAAAGAVVWLAWRRLGGFTGDVLGAAGMVGETVGLLVAAARW